MKDLMRRFRLDYPNSYEATTVSLKAAAFVFGGYALYRLVAFALGAFFGIALTLF